MMSSRARRFAVLLLAAFGAIAGGCRLDGLLRISVDLADRLPADAREGSKQRADWIDGDAGNEVGDILRLYFFPGVQAVTGNNEDKPMPDLEFEKAREVHLDLPGDRRIVESIELEGVFTVENTGGTGVFLDPGAEIFVAPPDAASVYDGTESHSVGRAVVRDEVVGTGDTVTLSVDDARVERDDPAFDVMEDGHFRLGLFVEVKLSGDPDNETPEEISWRVDTATIKVTGRPIRALD